MPSIEPDWLCPLCALVRMPYGTTCKAFHEGTCEHLNKAHITGRMYLKPTEEKIAKGTGISQISDER